jgi:gamma-glutamyl:cysteine ligase YbdK (ATP-grasp superfamily)
MHDELDFKPSPALTVGVELELQLVRPHDLDLARGASDLLASSISRVPRRCPATLITSSVRPRM